ncbi:MAG: hypothetical protein ACXWQR_21205 [Ktedonobacterales bacterium]
MPEPMTDVQLQQIRKRLGSIIIFPEKAMGDVQMLADTANALLAEVERLKAENGLLVMDIRERQEKEHERFQRDMRLGRMVPTFAAMREVLQEMTDYTRFYDAAYPALWQRARALLAKSEDNTNGE